MTKLVSIFTQLKYYLYLKNEINETLKTYPLDFFKRRLKDVLKRHPIIYEIINDNEAKPFIEILFKTGKNLISLENFIEILYEITLSGYKLSSIIAISPKFSEESKDDIKEIKGEDFEKNYLSLEWFNSFISLEIKIEAKYDISIPKINDKGYRIIPDFIYHITDKKYLSKILKMGLIPKSENKQSSHPERIYFTLDLEYARLLGPKLTKSWVILKVNIIKYENLEFFQDPKGIYSYDNFNPERLELIDQSFSPSIY